MNDNHVSVSDVFAMLLLIILGIALVGMIDKLDFAFLGEIAKGLY